MKKKLKIVVPVALLLVVGGVYKTVLAKPPQAPKPRVEGQVYVLPKEFLLNLADGRFAKLSVGLVLAHDQATAGAAEGAKPPDGYGTLEQEAVIRDIVTDDLTDVSGGDLIDRRRRDALKRRLLRDLRKHTDVKVEQVLFTDVAVQ
ncbi:MAG: flagellar basal body-associated FliL family protein [Thermoleophilaceae bacterium]|nr:flagellar basal body-associated FliL family protein [Thermoleophilaceae bacterium]